MSAMKRLAVLVRNEKVDTVITALREVGLDSIIYDVKSAGKEKGKTKSGRGTGGTIDVLYVPRKIVATVVDPNKIQEVSDVIKKTIGNESKGVIMVSSVDDFIPF